MTESRKYDCSRGCVVERAETGELDCTYRQGCCKLEVYDWLSGVNQEQYKEYFEVRFKNTRKGIYRNASGQSIKMGDMVIVEAANGHDLGIVTLEGPIVGRQMKCKRINPETFEFRKIYRKAKIFDIEKWQEAIAREHETMIRSRQIAEELGLEMKIGDVEFQGDGTKAIFYYIADGRVDFRQLIKVFAEEFRIRIEMKQIGARQEAGLIGGLGVCGRELCCAAWMTNFVSVSTSAARYQDISLNPQKLAGQCAKLKCCLNYEVDVYVESQKRLPSKEIALETKEGTFYFFKADILKGLITYSSDKNFMSNACTIPSRRAFEIISMNKQGEKPESLTEGNASNNTQKIIDLVEQESLTRFDKRRNSNNRKKKKKQSAVTHTPSEKKQKAPNESKNKEQNNQIQSENSRNKKDSNINKGNKNKEKQSHTPTEKKQAEQATLASSPKQ